MPLGSDHRVNHYENQINALQQQLADSKRETFIVKDGLQEAINDVGRLEQQIAEAQERISAFEKAWELPPQGAGQGITPSVGEQLANAKAEATHYRQQLADVRQELDKAQGLAGFWERAAFRVAEDSKSAEQERDRYRDGLTEVLRHIYEEPSSPESIETIVLAALAQDTGESNG